MMVGGRVVSVLGGGGQTNEPTLLAKWRRLDYPFYIPPKIPPLCFKALITCWDAHNNRALEGIAQ